MDFPVAELFRLGTTALERQAVKAVIAVLCLHFTAMFIQIADSLSGEDQLLYWLCVMPAIATGVVGLGGCGVYAYRMLFPGPTSPGSGKPEPSLRPRQW